MSVSGPRVFVTGATGYIGSRLAIALQHSGYEVHALLRVGSDDDLLRPVAGRITLHETGFEPASLQALLSEHSADVVIHLASNFVATHTAGQIPALLQSNITLGTNLLEACAGSGVRCFINTTTQWEFWKDADRSPVCLYAASKRAFQQIVDFYASACAIDVVTLALTDTYGPNDPRGKILGKLIEAGHSGDELAMSPGEQLLDLVHVDDVVSAFQLTVSAMLGNDDKQFCGNQRYELYSGAPVSLRQLARLVERALGKTLELRWGEREYREREVFAALHVSAPLPRWQPQIQLVDGIAAMLQQSAVR